MLGPDRRGEGTNALLLRLAGRGPEFTFAFGDGSLAKHLEEARRLGLVAAVHDAPGIAFDLDTPDDWSDFLQVHMTADCLGRGRVDPGGVRRERRVSDGGEVRIIGIDGMPEVAPGDDLASLIGDGIAASGERLEPGDIVVVTHKIVSKAEGQVVDLRTITPSPLATEFGERWDKDPRKIEIVLREARRIVRMHNGLIIAETAHGFVCANAGVDASNASPDTVVLLPKRPRCIGGESARGIATAVRTGRRRRSGGHHQRFVRPAVAQRHRQRRDWRQRNGAARRLSRSRRIRPATSCRRRSWRLRTRWPRRRSW